MAQACFSARWMLVAGVSLAAWGCGIRNLGESCNLPGGGPPELGDFLCAPDRCDPGLGICVECLKDYDCLKQDIFDRPKCVRGVPLAQAGDGRPYCKHIADHPVCGPPLNDLQCLPGVCAADAGVCVECVQDSDCKDPRRSKCKGASGPDTYASCVESK